MTSISFQSTIGLPTHKYTFRSIWSSISKCLLEIQINVDLHETVYTQHYSKDWLSSGRLWNPQNEHSFKDHTYMYNFKLAMSICMCTSKRDTPAHTHNNRKIRVFSLNFWWGDSKFLVPVGRSPTGTKSDGGGNLQKKSDWSQNCPPNAELGHFLQF